MILSIQDRFWGKVDKNGPTGCWLWTASITRSGYGHFRIGSKLHPAHRVAYELSIGQIPEGLQLDHLCRVRRCVNPKHLEPVTNQENCLRGDNAQRRKTHCPKGHPYDVKNTIHKKDNRRICRTCTRNPRQPTTHCKKGHEYTFENTSYNMRVWRGWNCRYLQGQWY